MIGEKYFGLRARLGNGLSALLTLAQELDATPTTRQLVQQLTSSLNEPFFFVVFGELKSGKSSLLNALFGGDFCRVDAPPATDKIYSFQFGLRNLNVPVSEWLTECQRPKKFLKDFNIVDTPGTNSLFGQFQRITDEFLPRADLVLFVFSVVNPWAPSAWEFLRRLLREPVKNLVFVVQQADLREAVEVDAVMNHLDRTTRERFSRKIPIFAVSARKAFDAKMGALDADELLAESNLTALERHIDATVAEGEVRMGKLRSVAREARAVLDGLAGITRAASGILSHDDERLSQLPCALDERKEDSRRQVAGALEALGRIYDEAQRKGEELLRSKLAFGQTMKLVFRKAEWQREIATHVRGTSKSPFPQQLNQALQSLEEDLRTVWGQLHGTMEEHFPADLQLPSLPADLKERRSAVLRRIGQGLIEKMSERGLDRQMGCLFAETANHLALPAVAPGGADALGAALAHRALVDVAGIAAGRAEAFGAAAALGMRNRILGEFSSRATGKKEAALAAVESQLHHAIDVFYQELDDALQPLRNLCSAQLQIYQPLLERAETLRRTFDAIEADLGHGAEP